MSMAYDCEWLVEQRLLFIHICFGMAMGPMEPEVANGITEVR